MAAVNPGNSAALAGRRPFFAQGKEWIGGRPTLLLPAAVLYRRSMLPRARNGLAAGQLCFCRRPFFTGGQCCPGQRNGLAAAQGQHIGGVLCPGQGSRIERRPAGGGNSAFAGRRSLPRAMDWQGQRGGRRRLTANSAQGKGMDWRRSILLLPIPAGQLCPCRPAAVLCPGQGMEWQQQRKAREWAKAAQGSRIDGGGQLCLCRPPFFALGKGMAAVNPGNSAAQGKGMDWRRSILLLPIPAGQLCPCRPAAVLCPGQGMEWQQQRKAREWAKAAQGSRIDGGGQLCPGQGKGMGSSAAAGGRQLCLCRPPFFAQGKGMAAVNPGNSAAQGKSIPTAVRGYYSRHCRPV